MSKMITVRTIFLIGFSGCGKSTVGPLLARRLRADFYDTDAMIEQSAGKPIAQIFEDDGETAFRALETDVIHQLAGNSRRKRVIALGGGAFENRENRELIAACGCTVYLQTSVPTIIKRLEDDSSRPLLQVHPRRGETMRAAVERRIRSLLEKRKTNYRRADLTISTTRPGPDEVVRTIIARLEHYNGTH